MNIDGVDASIEGIVQVDIPAAWASLDLGSEAGGWREIQGKPIREHEGTGVRTCLIL